MVLARHNYRAVRNLILFRECLQVGRDALVEYHVVANEVVRMPEDAVYRPVVDFHGDRCRGGDIHTVEFDPLRGIVQEAQPSPVGGPLEIVGPHILRQIRNGPGRAGPRTD